MKKLQEIVVEEERQRIPIAQGLPWTTDEPEVRPFLDQVNWLSWTNFNFSIIRTECSFQTNVLNHMKKQNETF